MEQLSVFAEAGSHQAFQGETKMSTGMPAYFRHPDANCKGR